ncbi:hypothetical protein [Halorubrum sp. Atlit-26R]|uniref:hypothetical protein n=1 Tax=Halorubrum sp. Atlit-26R TaxID=2282128 RepID=UPI000EF26EDD|nr:hypothetical protein [Halorubrum sp. Atlit-26R]RLM72979.1 hypothetical protein DVK07_05635 [Halorubrum sp. Atlit-26R]
MAGEDLNANDPYDVLGLSRGATEDEVENRARSLLDKYSDDHDARTAINEAFEEIQKRPSPVEVGDTTVVPLLVSATPDTVSVGGEVTFRVTDHTDDGVAGVGLQRAGDGRRMAKTDDDGTESIRFKDVGTVEIVAKKKQHPDPDHEYKKGEAEVEVERQSESLSFAACPDAVEVGEEFAVRVVDSNGNPQGDVTVTTDAGSSTSTDGNGEATLTADRVGGLTVEASKPPSSAKEFSDAEATVSVKQRQVDLRFDQSPTRLSVDARGTFKVIDEDRSPVRGVTVSVGSAGGTTDDDGEVTLSFGDVTPGTRTVTASKGDTGGLTFTDARTEVEVTKRTSDLDIRVLDTPVVGDSVRFEVTAGGDGVQHATVRSFDGDVAETDGDGVARLTFSSFGKTTVVASKSDTEQTVFGQGSCSVDVERTTEQLRISEYDSTEDGRDIEAGDDVVAKVISVGGGPVEGATVEAEDGTSAETDDDGRATVTFNGQGQKRLKTSKPPDERASYESHTEYVNVKQRTKELFLESVNAPRSVSAGDPVTFRVVDELGNELANTTVYAKDERDQRKETDGNGEVTFEFDVDNPQFIEVYARPDNDQFDRYDSETIRVTP